MPSPRSRHISWTASDVTLDDRTARNGHRGAVIWLTGLSGSGKSTLARLLERELFDRGCQCAILDGDNIRHGLNRDLGFSPEDRTENIRRIGEVAGLLRAAGLICISAFISPYRDDRARARAVCPPGTFLEVHCQCSLEECERRDPKGLYRKARAGEIPQFTGISAPYEAPEDPEVAVETGRMAPAACVEQVIAALRARGILDPTAPAAGTA